jgi:hypothetical protein
MAEWVFPSQLYRLGREHAWVSPFQRSASKPPSQRSVSVFDDEDELRRPSVNVRFGSKADIRRYPVERPLLGVKRTLVKG